MKKKLSISLICLVGCISLTAQNYFTGLKPSTAQELAGIPIASMPYSGAELPDKIDLSVNMPPVGKQEHHDCVAWAIAYAIKSYQEKKEENNQYLLGGQLNLNSVFCPSFLYNQLNNGVDGGCGIIEALNSLSQQGAAKFSVMPYSRNSITTLPNQQQINAAKNYKIDYYRQVNIRDIKEVKAQLIAGYPIVIGASINDGFVTDGRNAPDPYIWKSRHSVDAYHAMVVVGYDDSYNAFKVMNSWGTSWGNNGYCWISYNLFPVVVDVGFIAKDAINGTNNINTPYQPPQPVAYLSGSFSLVNVIHNIPNYNWGQGMNFIGTVQLPSGIGHTYQIVIRFYFNNGMNGKGFPIASNAIQFSFPDGTAATATPLLNTPSAGAYNSNNSTNGFVLNWDAGMPYGSFRLNPGISYIVAEPILYIDNFAVQIGQLVPIIVSR